MRVISSAWLALVLCACGRVGFENHALPDDASAHRDAPAAHIIDAGLPIDMGPHPEAGTCVGNGHDEDGDGIDEGCDLCPWIADVAQPDTDGDFIGDACDPDASPESIALFDPFTADIAAWHYGDAHSYVNDSLRIGSTTDYTGQYLLTGVARDHLTLGGHVDATATDAGQLVMGVGPVQGDATYFCELYQDAGGLILGLTYTLDNANYVNVKIVGLPGTLAGKDYVFELDRDPPNVTCAVTWMGTRHVATAPIPAGVPEEVYYLAQNNAQIDLKYFARVAY